jgi:hypothetical protein
MKIAVYTAITGGFEPFRDDCIVFNDYDRFKSPRLNAKIYKILPHLFLPEYDVTVWLDGNIRFAPGTDIEQFVNDWLDHGKYDLAAFAHPYRNNALQELEAVDVMGLDYKAPLVDQHKFYERISKSKIGYESHRLAECGVLVRKNVESVRRMNEMWWAHICRFSSRDQISFPVVLYNMWRSHILTYVLHTGNVREDKRFIYTPRQSSQP